MVGFQTQHVMGNLPAGHVSGVSALALLEDANGGQWLVAQSAGSGAFSTWRLSETGTAPQLVAQVSTGTADGPTGLAGLATGQIDGQPVLWSHGLAGQGVTGHMLAPNGALGAGFALGGGAAAISALADLGSHVALAASDGSGLAIWGRSAAGSWQETGQIAAGSGLSGPDILALTGVQVGGQSYLVAASAHDNAISAYQVSAAGVPQHVSTIGAATGLALNGPAELRSVTMGDAVYVLAAAPGNSTLTVLRLDSSGELRFADQVGDTLDTRFAGISVLEVVQTGDHVLVVAGGSDDGLSLMTLLPGGRLLHLDTIADSTALGLENPAALSARITAGGDLELHVAGGGNDSGILSVLSVDLGGLGEVLEAAPGGGILTGGTEDDILAGQGGADRLSGGGGDDILMDGAGADTLTGGAGADVFVLSLDGATDRITDFQLGIDRLDLSQLGRFYSVSALEVTATVDGALIRFGTETLRIVTSDGTPLEASMLDYRDVLDLWHLPDPASLQGVALKGGGGADRLAGDFMGDTLIGGQGDDTLIGGAGDDTLYGGDPDALSNADGADRFEGGDGSDWVSYEGSFGSLRIDLQFSQLNTFTAAGDTYDSIENLIGSQGPDNMRGTIGGDNHMMGGRNVDYMFGRSGDDTLEGGIGDDVLFGGVGADVLIGGTHRDRAQYSESLTALVLDLADASRNTGEAAGDSYDSIEDLAGGRFADSVSGDSGSNRLFGREGADSLYGRAGDDYLNGGAHADRLAGGGGDDTLRGGSHNDTFVFNDGHDVIEDFNLTHADRIAIDDDGIAAVAGMSGAQVVAAFGSVTGGQVVLDFGVEGSITVESLDSLTGLDEHVFVF